MAREDNLILVKMLWDYGGACNPFGRESRFILRSSRRRWFSKGLLRNFFMFLEKKINSLVIRVKTLIIFSSSANRVEQRWQKGKGKIFWFAVSFVITRSPSLRLRVHVPYCTCENVFFNKQKLFQFKPYPMAVFKWFIKRFRDWLHIVHLQFFTFAPCGDIESNFKSPWERIIWKLPPSYTFCTNTCVLLKRWMNYMLCQLECYFMLLLFQSLSSKLREKNY